MAERRQSISKVTDNMKEKRWLHHKSVWVKHSLCTAGGGGEWRELNNIRAINFIRKTQEVVVPTRDACEGCWEIVSLKGEV